MAFENEMQQSHLSNCLPLLLDNIIVRGSLMARNSQVELVTLYAAETTQPSSVPLMVNCEP